MKVVGYSTLFQRFKQKNRSICIACSMLSRLSRGCKLAYVSKRYFSELNHYIEKGKVPEKTKTLDKFNFPSATCSILHINQNLQNLLVECQKPIILHGHLNRKPRTLAARSFAELRDENGDLVQILMTPGDTDIRYFQMLKEAKPEDSICVTGCIQLKKPKPGETKKEWELLVKKYQTLNNSNIEAARLEKLKQVSPKDIAPKFRYLQLRTPFYQKALRKRSEARSLILDLLINQYNFVEIETPLLFKSTPEGAREFLVPTRAPEKFYALPQSPQQYKQILMSSGFTRYFQIAKCFRDEDLRSDRQPEFTQVDLEMGFVNDSKQVRLVVESLIHSVWNKVANIPTYLVNGKGQLEQIEFESLAKDECAFNELKYVDALRYYGIDKPDMRYDLCFKDLSSFFIPLKGDPAFPILEACILKGAFNPAEKFKLPHSLIDSNNYARRKPIVIAIKTPEEAEDWYEVFLSKSVFQKTENFDQKLISKYLNLEPGDVLAFCTRSEFPYENPTPLGKFRQLAIEEFPNKWLREVLNKKDKTLLKNPDPRKLIVGTWVVDFPLFNPVETNSGSKSDFPSYSNCFESTHHPFTMPKMEDYDLLERCPLQVRGEHYDLVVNGVEIGGGSRRIHDPELQQYIFENILKIHNYKDLFGHLLDALSMGCPPHAGLALGFDRLCAMLVGSSSIRDVIAFPKNQSGVDPVVESPTSIEEERLREYFIKPIQ